MNLIATDYKGGSWMLANVVVGTDGGNGDDSGKQACCMAAGRIISEVGKYGT